MGERNWGMIQSGAMFEALATRLIFFEDPKAALFGRPGKDGGQDARSGDDELVYQAKYHQDASASKAISDARKEVLKIAKYRAQDHARYEQWKSVKRWLLVTNAVFNPTDRATWELDIVPDFQSLGLEAGYWEQRTLDGLLDKHPEVDRSFFGGETRAFLTLPEVRDRLPSDEPFLRRSLSSFFGREDESGEFRSFLASDELFLVVHGAGGIGKTRLLVECGEEIAGDGEWQVLWANVASMEASGSWFRAIIPERPTLLLVDEPEDPQLLRVLAEQLGGRRGRTAKWKVAVAVRSPNDPVLRFLFGPRMCKRVRELRLGRLAADAAEAMCRSLLASGPLAMKPESWRTDAARHLAERFSQHPIWLTLAVHVLEVTGDLGTVPTSADDLAAFYLDEITTKQQGTSREQSLALMRWVALLGTVNLEQPATVAVLQSAVEASGGEVRLNELLARLVARRALAERGARNRLVEVKPDVMRDHLLMSWLAADVGFGTSRVKEASTEARELVDLVLDAVFQGQIGTLARAVLGSLARTELMFRFSGNEVPLLQPFFSRLSDDLDRLVASARVALVELLAEIAVAAPRETLSMLARLRSSPVATEAVEGVFRAREVGQEDVVLEMAWTVLHAAMGAATTADATLALRELCELAEAEAEIGRPSTRRLPNDGKRASQMIGRVIEGGPNFRMEFDEIACEVAVELLDNATRETVSDAEAEVIRALVRPAVSLDRQHVSTEGHTLHIGRSVVAPGSSAWTIREALINVIKRSLETASTPESSRSVLWELLSHSHHEANRALKQVEGLLDEQLHGEMLRNLDWAHGVLSARSVALEELAAARDLWTWHVQFEEESRLRAAAERLERVYAENDLAGEFEPLLSYKRYKEHDASALAKATDLARTSSAEIRSFLERGLRFLGGPEHAYRLRSVVWRLGELAPGSGAAREFVRGSLGGDDPGWTIRLGAVAAAGWVSVVRESAPQEVDALVGDLLLACRGKESRIVLLLEIYGRSPPPRDAMRVTPEEHARVRALADDFAAENRTVDFIRCVGWGFHHDWVGFKELVEHVLDEIDAEHLSSAVDVLVDTVSWVVREDGSESIPSAFSQWLLDQVSRVPDLDGIGGTFDWHLEEILKITGRPSVLWLADAIGRRRAMEKRQHEPAVRAVGRRTQLAKYVRRLEPGDAAQAEICEAIASLLSLATDAGTAGYYLPEIVGKVDPRGVLVPALVADSVQGAQDVEEVRRFARIGAAYAVNSPEWREIAKPVIAFSARLETSQQRSLFNALGRIGVRSWSGKPGEVPEVFIANFRRAQEFLEAEVDGDFRAFWEWNVEAAMAELREQEEHAKEERGE